MTTPLGWLRANLAYDKGPFPEPGTLYEVVLLMVQNLRFTQNVAQTKALAQAGLGGEAAVTAWKQYTDMVFEPANKAQKQKLAEALKEVEGMGPISVRPLVNTAKKNLPVFKRQT